MPTLNPLSDPDAYDKVYVGGIACPGYVKIGDVKRAHEFDVKKGKGTLGATVTFVGRPPAKFSVTFYLWEEHHWDEWETFRPLLKYDPTKTAVQAVQLYHPALARIDLKDVVVEGIGAEKNEGLHLWSIEVDFLEYFPPPPRSAVSTPTSSKDQATKTPSTGAAPDPIADEQQKQIAALSKEAGLT